MKRFFRIFVLAIFVLPICLLVGCDDNKSLKIVNIQETATTDTTVTYTITYEDDSTFSWTVPMHNVSQIVSIDKTETNNNKDIYTLTLSAGSTTNFEVANGVSVQSIDYHYTDGLRDYYTINYSNGTTSSYSILNGKDGNQGVTIEDMYAEANKDNKYTDITEFIQDYLSISINGNSTTIASGKAVLSAVSVYSEFPSVSRDFWGEVVSKNTGLSAGAGVIYKLDKENGDAYIITNCHVVYNEETTTIDNYAKKIYCYLYGQESSIKYDYESDGTTVKKDSDGYPIINNGEYAIPCTLIGASIKNDIAVLKVDNSEVLKNSNAVATSIANSEDVYLGSNAIAIGNPDMGGISVTSGVISVISEYIEVGIDTDIDTVLREFRIDTAVNSGNSGGGLFNDKAELIGIVNAKTSKSTIENMGYAIPSNVAVNIADNIIYNYETDGQFGIEKIYLGLTVGVKSSKAEYDSEKLTTKIVEIVKVEETEDDCIAKSIGLEAGDIINSIVIIRNGETTSYNITKFYQVTEIMLTVRVGDYIAFNCTSNEGYVTYSHTAVAEDFIDVA